MSERTNSGTISILLRESHYFRHLRSRAWPTVSDVSNCRTIRPIVTWFHFDSDGHAKLPLRIKNG